MTNENIHFIDSTSLNQAILDLHEIKVQSYQEKSISYHGLLRRIASEKGLQTKVPKNKHTNIYWDNELIGKMNRLRPGTTYKDTNKICGDFKGHLTFIEYNFNYLFLVYQNFLY